MLANRLYPNGMRVGAEKLASLRQEIILNLGARGPPYLGPTFPQTLEDRDTASFDFLHFKKMAVKSLRKTLLGYNVNTRLI